MWQDGAGHCCRDNNIVSIITLRNVSDAIAARIIGSDNIHTKIDRAVDEKLPAFLISLGAVQTPTSSSVPDGYKQNATGSIWCKLRRLVCYRNSGRTWLNRFRNRSGWKHLVCITYNACLLYLCSFGLPYRDIWLKVLNV